MPSFYLTQKAKADLKDIARYTETTWGREQRNAYLEKLDAAFHDLANAQGMGRKAPYILSRGWWRRNRNHPYTSRQDGC